MRSVRATVAILLTAAVGCAAALVGVVPASAATTVWKCTTSAARGSCGPYDRYPYITGTTSSTYIGNNVWSPVPGWRQTLRADNPGRWGVNANMPAGNSAVVSYPSVGANYGRITNVPTPLSRYSRIHSRFIEHMNATAHTSAWATYDIWLGRNGCSDCGSHEVMIQHDFANNGACTTVARADFPGARGTRQHWHLCTYGSELIWKLGRSERNKVSEQTGVVPILAMLRWLVRHQYLPPHTGLWMVGYGWEIASTGGRTEKFRVSAYRLHVSCKRRGCR
ncbi:MAG TPA: hypothetical protein VFT75_11980 [Nocardioidaceae bacterium]|jgi:hypothetical protein|nr:hypothetical protein [Nocardioidaceae bacterium]